MKSRPSADGYVCSGGLGDAVRFERWCGGIGIVPVAGQQIVERVAIAAQDDASEHIGKVGVRVDATQLARLDQRGDRRPVLGAELVAGEEGVLTVMERYA
ncbi:hypothetical protein JI59_04145 [Novosphingobium pentaromativorans US6-1]|nr:hypothetical protein JI59_04145 [Novosphingobium pentaromativorans US6-1]